MTDSEFDKWLPIVTLAGTKWVPTIKPPYFGCSVCPVRDLCAADVNRGDFAWCEEVDEVDYILGYEAPRKINDVERWIDELLKEEG